MKETVMLLKVDLQCPCSYEKIKKLLCKFPEIRNQVYDDKGNKVTITVLSCNPEKIRDQLACKGAKVITSIEIIVPKEVPKPSPDKPKEVPKPSTDKPKEVHFQVRICCGQCYEGHGGGTCCHYPVRTCCGQCYGRGGPCYNYPVRTCCGQCYEGHGGGPCYQGY